VDFNSWKLVTENPAVELAIVVCLKPKEDRIVCLETLFMVSALSLMVGP